MFKIFDLKNSLLIIIAILGLVAEIFSQDWDNIDDSTYNNIIKNRFNKGNFIFGLGGTIKSGYDELSFTGIGIRPSAGFFIADKWMLTADFDYYYAWVRETKGKGKGTLRRYLIGLNGRHYFKPKHRAIFIEFGPIIGNETRLTDEFDSIDSYNNIVYGGKLGIGISVFIRRFEIELIAGLKIYGNDYSADNFYNNFYQLLQINLSYIFKPNHKKN